MAQNAVASIADVNIEFAIASYSRMLEKKTVNERGCFIPHKVPRSDGYVRYSITAGSAKTAFGPSAKEVERTFYLHHLAWYATGHKMPVPRKEHLSHLCSDSRCFNVKHLIVETPEVNNSRKNCGYLVTCPCGCNHTFVACPHSPPCISRSREKRKSND